MLDVLHAIRKEEFDSVFEKITLHLKNSNVLEIGSGTGFQLELLSSRFKDAEGVEIEESDYAAHRPDRLKIYDGHHLPFPDNSFDYIFSSNVLEHIPHLEEIETEFKRVLKPDGLCIHVLPTHTWRFWTIITHYLTLVQRIYSKVSKQKDGGNEKIKSPYAKKRSTVERIKNILFPERHGERGNRFNEMFYFNPNWWKKHFSSNDWIITADFPAGLFYTGYTFLGMHLGMKKRRSLSRVLGSSCHVYIMRMSA